MSEASTSLHEPLGRLSDDTVDLHRALVSLQEELQAIDWYRQRADACHDDALRAILDHNMAEEIEHAAMLLEWLRRHHPRFAEQFDTYLYSEKAVVAIEESAANGFGEAQEEDAHPVAADGGETRSADAFTVGPMKERE